MMMCQRDAIQLSIDPTMPTRPLRDCVRRALCLRHARWHAAVAVAAIASVAPLALGAAFAPVFPLASLYPAAGGNGSQGFVLAGINRDDHSGESVSGAGDVNGDGIADLIIGADHGSYSRTFSGETYVVFGSTQGFPAIMPLSSLFPFDGGDGSRGFVLTGARQGDQAGASVSNAGDVNGDGIDDLIIGAYDADPNGHLGAGASYVVFGSTQAFPAVFPLETLHPSFGGDGTRGFILEGIDPDDRSGCAVSAAGDVNGDGVDDLIIGATFADTGFNGQDDEGESYVVFGSTQGFPAVFQLASLSPDGGGDGSRGFVLAGIHDIDTDQSGGSVSTAGDINGDGVADVIIGAWQADPNERDGAGESYVVFGSTQAFPAIFPLESLYPSDGGDGSDGFVITGVREGDESGVSVSGAGDVNGDGIDDLIVGAESVSPGGVDTAGAGYVVFGSTQGFPAVVPLASLYPARGGDGSRGFVLPGIAAVDSTGRSVSAAGDINADGIDDVMVGGPNSSPNGKYRAGESYVVFGSTQSFPAVFPLASLFAARGGDGSHGFVLTGVDESDYSGTSVSAAGDINGDGIDDVIVGAFAADPRGNSTAGESYVVFGRSAAR